MTKSFFTHPRHVLKTTLQALLIPVSMPPREALAQHERNNQPPVLQDDLYLSDEDDGDLQGTEGDLNDDSTFMSSASSPSSDFDVDDDEEEEGKFDSGLSPVTPAHHVRGQNRPKKNNGLFPDLGN